MKLHLIGSAQDTVSRISLGMRTSSPKASEKMI